MSNPDIVRVRHMLDAAQEALSFVGDKSRAELDANRMLTLSLVKSIEIVGEAASRVSSAFRATHGNPLDGYRDHAKSTDPCLFRC